MQVSLGSSYVLWNGNGLPCETVHLGFFGHWRTDARLQYVFHVLRTHACCYMHDILPYSAIDVLCPIDAVICVRGPPMCCCNIWAFCEGPVYISQTYQAHQSLFLIL